MLGLGKDYDIGLSHAPVDLATAGFTGKRIWLGDCAGVDIVLLFAVGTDGDDPVPALEEHTASVSGTTRDLAVMDTIYRKSETALDNDETWVKTTQTAAAIMTAVADDAQKQNIYVIHVEASSLSDDCAWVSVKHADLSNNAQLTAGIYLKVGLKSQRAPVLLPNLLLPSAANA